MDSPTIYEGLPILEEELGLHSSRRNDIHGPKRQKTFCCSVRQSIFIGGKHLEGVSSGKIKNLLSEIIQIENCHILKCKSETYGHIHFKTENDAGLFFQRVQGQTFDFEYNDDPSQIKTISIEFFPSKESGSNKHSIYKIQPGAPPAPETSKTLPIPGTSKVTSTSGTITALVPQPATSKALPIPGSLPTSGTITAPPDRASQQTPAS
ncbi:hypothetical protein C1646_765955 [Rhizophagus diaphanus]|nr:hypothetical protein C1646_765955 [Rhizophagus diaphanus] [Rhizophagus sp. MUCL 43196]